MTENDYCLLYDIASKRITELEKEKQGLKDYCDKYTKTILSLRKNVAELEAQIEKMKCCQNCEKYKNKSECGNFTRLGFCDKWEIRK